MSTDPLPPGTRSPHRLMILGFFAVLAYTSAVLWTWFSQGPRVMVTAVILTALVVSIAACQVEATMVNAYSDGRPVYWVSTQESSTPLQAQYSTRRFIVSLAVGLVVDIAIVSGLFVRQGGPTLFEVAAILAAMAITGEALTRTWAGLRRFRREDDEGPPPRR